MRVLNGCNNFCKFVKELDKTNTHEIIFKQLEQLRNSFFGDVKFLMSILKKIRSPLHLQINFNDYFG